MLKIRRLLVATDHSACAKAAVDLAVEMARSFGATLLLVHVVPTPGYPNVAALMTSTFPTLHEELRRQGEEALRELAASLPQDVPIEIHVREGHAAQEIVDCATHEHADMLVIGTHGYTGWKHGLLGSTAERVVRTATVPVVTTHQRAA